MTQRIEINYPIGWLQDALGAAYPTLGWHVRGIDREWAEVELAGRIVISEGRRSIEDGGTLPKGFDLATFAGAVTETVRVAAATESDRIAELGAALVKLAEGKTIPTVQLDKWRDAQANAEILP